GETRRRWDRVSCLAPCSGITVPNRYPALWPSLLQEPNGIAFAQILSSAGEVGLHPRSLPVGSALGRGGTGMKEKERSDEVGVLGAGEEGEGGMAELRTAGFEDSHLTMVMHHDNQGVEVTDLDRAKAARITGESKAEEGAALGAAVGAVAGGLLGLIPGIGPV